LDSNPSPEEIKPLKPVDLRKEPKVALTPVNLRKDEPSPVKLFDAIEPTRHLEDFTGLRKVAFSINWTCAPRLGGLESMFKYQPKNIDLDLSVIICDINGRARDVVFYANRQYQKGAITLSSDNRLGGNDTVECERIDVDLAGMPNSVAKLVFAVNIYGAEKNKQHFGIIGNAAVGLYDVSFPGAINALCRVELARADYHGMSGMIVGEIERYDRSWEFKALRKAIHDAGSLKKIVSIYEFDNIY
jgi:stress response protein SCP2